MSNYWANHPDFEHIPTAPVKDEFSRLAELRGWKPDEKKYARQWAQCGRAEFEHFFGIGDPGLEGWQEMCSFVKVTVGDSITQCKKALRTEGFVNIFDLVDAKRMGKRRVKKYGSAQALRNYTLSTKKIYPKKQAKSNPFLKVFLIEIFA